MGNNDCPQSALNISLPKQDVGRNNRDGYNFNNITLFMTLFLLHAENPSSRKSALIHSLPAQKKTI